VLVGYCLFFRISALVLFQNFGITQGIHKNNSKISEGMSSFSSSKVYLTTKSSATFCPSTRLQSFCASNKLILVNYYKLVNLSTLR
jgi:hypothetical protein